MDGEIDSAPFLSWVSARNSNVVVIAEKRDQEESTSQELEAGGNGEICLNVLPMLTWNAGCITTM